MDRAIRRSLPILPKAARSDGRAELVEALRGRIRAHHQALLRLHLKARSTP